MDEVSKGQAYGESAFDILYLIVVIVLGVWFVSVAQMQHKTILLLYGCMSLVLGIGDSFHLVPRILSHLASKPERFIPHLGIGKMITSITMTIFYVMLYYVWAMMYPSITLSPIISVVVIVLAIIRILLCLCPQNEWKTLGNNGNWAVYRNIPFFLLGIVVVLLYAYSGYRMRDGFVFMPLAIFLSFLFYAPVTLWVDKNPKLGMLMIPKTIMYVWIVCMGIQLL